jgi:preprotein translocase subunit YajC
MIAFLKGTVAAVYDGAAEIDVNGVGYEVRIAGDTVQRLASAGRDEEIKIYANGEVKTLIDKATAEEGDREIYIPDYCTSVFAIVDTATEDTVKIEVYNSVGTKLDIAIVNVEFDSDCVECYADSNNALLISGINEEGEYVYYRVG